MITFWKTSVCGNKFAFEIRIISIFWLSENTQWE